MPGYVNPPDGAEYTWANFWKTNFIPVPSGSTLRFTTPTFNGIPLSSASGKAVWAHRYNANKEWVSSINIGASLPQSFSISSDIKYIKIAGATLTQSLTYADIDTIQLELGDTATPYSPFVGDEIEIPYTMRGAVGIADEYNIVNGMFTKRLNEVTLTGTEAWYYDTSTSTSSYTTIYMTAASLGMLTNSQCICTHFPDEYTGGSEYWIIGELFNLRFANSRLGVTSENTQAERLAAAKAWLAQHTAGTPVTIQYELATPVTSTLHPQNSKPIIHSRNYTRIARYPQQ